MSLPILQNSRSGLISSRLVETDVDAAAMVNNNAEIWCKKKLQIVSYRYNTFMNRTPETQRGQRLYFQRTPIREKASEKPVFSLSLWMYRRPNRYAQLKTRRTYTAPIDMRVGGTTDIARDRSTNGWTCFRLFVAGWEDTYRIDGSPAECKGDRKSWDKGEVSLGNIRYECIERREEIRNEFW